MFDQGVPDVSATYAYVFVAVAAAKMLVLALLAGVMFLDGFVAAVGALGLYGGRRTGAMFLSFSFAMDFALVAWLIAHLLVGILVLWPGAGPYAFPGVVCLALTVEAFAKAIRAGSGEVARLRPHADNDCLLAGPAPGRLPPAGVPMSNQEMNRAQRRQTERQAKAHRPTFWDSIFNRIWSIALVAAFIGVIGYSLFFKPDPAATAKKPPVTPPPVQPVQQPVTPPAPKPVAAPKSNEKVTTEDVKVGAGPTIKMGDSVVVHYTGTLTDGTKFDSSRDRNQPYTFMVGQGVIEGWSQGVVGMKKGGRRKIVVPPSLGYGAQDKGKIPPNSTLNFDIEVLEIKYGPQ